MPDRVQLHRQYIGISGRNFLVGSQEQKSCPMSTTHKGGVERASARSRGSDLNKALPVKRLKKADEVAQAPTDAPKKTPGSQLRGVALPRPRLTASFHVHGDHRPLPDGKSQETRSYNGRKSPRLCNSLCYSQIFNTSV